MNTFSKENLEEVTLKIETLALKDTKNNIIFTFEDIIHLDNVAISRILQNLDNSDLLKALRGTNAALQEKFFSNMSPNLAAQLKEDFEYQGPVPLSKVLDSRNKIIKLIEELAKKSEITINKEPVL